MSSTVDGTGTQYVGKRIRYRHVLVPALIAAVAVGVYLAVGRLARRPVYIVNRLAVPVTVSLDGGEPLRVVPNDRREVTLRAGKHRAVIRREPGPEESVEFETASDERVYVLNPGAAAVLLRESVMYNPAGKAPPRGRESAPPPPQVSVHYGQPFFALPKADFLFAQFPQSLKIQAGPGDGPHAATRTRLSVLEMEPLPSTYLLAPFVPAEELLGLTEHYLTLDPASKPLLRRYIVLGLEFGLMARAKDFLARGLDRRPIVVEWHRLYQSACTLLGQDSHLVSEYGRLLEKWPNDSALCYLRGRIAGAGSDAMAWYEKAIAADPKNAYPWRAKAHQGLSRGEFAAAKAACAEAHRLDPDDPETAELFFDIRLALGEHEALEAELRQAHAQRPLDGGTLMRLLELLVVRGNAAGAREVQDAFAKRARAFPLADPAQAVLESTLTVAYLEDHPAAVLAAAKQLSHAPGPTVHSFNAYVGLGKLGDAELLVDQLPASRRGYSCLLLSLGWLERGDREKAEAWWKRAIAQFATGSQDDRATARVLEKGEAARMDDVRELMAGPADQATILVALAEHCPARRRELLDLATRLNFSLRFPHHVLKRRIAATEK